MKKISFLTGTRADFGKIYPIIHLLSKKNFNVELIVTGMHLLKTFGSTINEIYNYWPLFLLVLLGGQLGNFLNLKIFPTRILALVTAALVIFVAIRVGLKLFV